MSLYFQNIPTGKCDFRSLILHSLGNMLKFADLLLPTHMK
mgnify:CR=1 FL=1